MSRTALVLIACLFLVPLASAQDPFDPITLRVGDPAPALHVGKWVKGGPIEKLEKGKVYVIEFWATWCGPCIQAMPHLTRVQKEYRDKGLTIIGMTTEDPNNSLAQVEAMVKARGTTMGYTVAWDDSEMTKAAWFRAAGQRSIPRSFVVDKEGKIAYIGHPMWLDIPVGHCLAGTWDLVKGQAELKAARDLVNAISRASGTDPAGALDNLVKLEATHPKLAAGLGDLKFNLLLGAKRYEQASKVGAELADRAIAEKNAGLLNGIAWGIVDPQSNHEKKDLALALRAAEKANEFTKEEDGAILDTLARVWFLKGDVEKAIELQKKALGQAMDNPGLLAELAKAMAEYKAKQQR